MVVVGVERCLWALYGVRDGGMTVPVGVVGCSWHDMALAVSV